MPANTRKKLIEVALPLEAINRASAAEKQPGIGAHPRGLHLWWARRPLAAARAVIFAQMVDDPSAWPDLFPTTKKQEKERERLFRIIEDLVKWENTTNEALLTKAREEIWTSWRRACAENTGHPRAKELFDRNRLPAFHDPFAGGGALPLEAQRLGLDSHASDLNPVAVLINKAMIEIPPKFSGKPPVNPSRDLHVHWKGAQGLAEDIRFYGKWMRDEAEKRIGDLYPKIEVTAEMAKGRSDLKPYVGQKLSVISWIWARTVKSPNPAFAAVHVPLASTFMLSTRAGKEAYVEPVIATHEHETGYRFTVRAGKPKDAEAAKNGTKLSRGANFKCLMSGTPIAGDYIKAEGKARRMDVRLMAIVAEGQRGRLYLPPTLEHEAAARKAKPEWKPEVTISGSTQYLGVKPYGIDSFDELFTSRQLVALTCLSKLVGEACERIRRDAIKTGLAADEVPLRDGGTGATAYAEAVAVYLSFSIDRLADYNSSIATWKASGEQVMQTFKRQALQMTWDFPESNILGHSAICWSKALKYTADNLETTGAVPSNPGSASQDNAATQSIGEGKITSTDPPYYDNVPYADLSDFFYVWLRHSLKSVFPDLFATLAVPKTDELVAFAYRHDGKSGAEAFFLKGMTRAMHRIAEQTHPAFPVTIYYAFKQAESDVAEGTASTGWETFLDAVIRAGFATSGTWPMRTELTNRIRGMESNALASSIVLVCRKRASNAPRATRRDLVAALKTELPAALAHLQAGNIAPVDLAQAAIGPGMSVYTRYAEVLNADGKPVSVREALALINATLDEALAEQEGDFDADSRWALTWFEQNGFSEGEYGVAEQLSKSKNTTIAALVNAGVVVSKAGKVRLLKPSELPLDWDPANDSRLSVWEVVHHLIRALESGGEAAAAGLVARIGAKAETARELAYRLYTTCERKKRATEAMAYNGLVQSFPEIARLARESGTVRPTQGGLFEAGTRG